MPVQPADIGAILNAFGQLGQANAMRRNRKDAAEAAEASTRGAIGGIAGGIAAGVASGGNPYAAMAGSAAGSQLLSGGKASGAQTVNQASQAGTMAQQQQAYQQAQDDRGAITRAGEYLNPPPQVQSSSINTPGQVIDSPDQAQPVQTPAMSRGEMSITQQQPNVRGAIGELFKAGQVGPAISLLAAQQKDADKGFTLNQNQNRYDAQGNLIVARGAGDGSDDPNKTEFERNLIRTTNQAIERGDIKAEERKEFQDNIIRQKLQSGETTASGGRMDKLDLDAAIKAVVAKRAKPGAGPSEIPSKAGEKPFTPEQAAKVAMINSAIKTHEGVQQALKTPEGAFDRQLIGTMNANVPFTQGRMVRQQMKDAIEARLRAESGAAVPDSEVERAMERFMPSSLDSDASIQSKLQRFDEWLKDISWLIQEGRAPKPETKQGKKNTQLKSKYGLE